MAFNQARATYQVKSVATGAGDRKGGLLKAKMIPLDATH